VNNGRMIRERRQRHTCEPPNPWSDRANWVVAVPGHPPRMRDGVRMPQVGDVWECAECGATWTRVQPRAQGHTTPEWVKDSAAARVGRRVWDTLDRTWLTAQDVVIPLAVGGFLVLLIVFLLNLDRGDDAGADDAVPVDTGAPSAAEAEAHEVLEDYLRAMVDNDWTHVYDMATDDARPNDRTMWTQRDTFVHKCTGEPNRRPVIDLLTLDHGDGTLIVEATVWVQSDQGVTCHWPVHDTPTGWRVGSYLTRASDSA